MKKLLTILLVLGSLTVFSQGTNMYYMKRLKTDTLYLMKADSSISSVWVLVWDSVTKKVGTKRISTGEADPVWLSEKSDYYRIGLADSTFDTIGHLHTISEVANLQDSLTNRYRRTDTATVLLSRTRAGHDYAPISHTQAISTITGLQDSLDNADAAKLGGQLPAWYAPIASPTFTGVSTMPNLDIVGGQLFITGTTPNRATHPNVIMMLGSNDTTLVDYTTASGTTTAYQHYMGGHIRLDTNIDLVSGLKITPVFSTDGSVRTLTNSYALYLSDGAKTTKTTVTNAIGLRIDQPTYGTSTNVALQVSGRSSLGSLDGANNTATISLDGASPDGIALQVNRTGNTSGLGRAILASASSTAFSVALQVDASGSGAKIGIYGTGGDWQQTVATESATDGGGSINTTGGIYSGKRIIAKKFMSVATDTTGVGSTANIGTKMYYAGHSYVLVAGTPPVWKQEDNDNDTINTPTFTTDIQAGTATRVLVIPAGMWVEAIKIIDAGTTAGLSAIEATQETSTVTLITGKSVATGTTAIFKTIADHQVYATAKNLTFTATGNSAAGMSIVVYLRK